MVMKAELEGVSFYEGRDLVFIKYIQLVNSGIKGDRLYEVSKHSMRGIGPICKKILLYAETKHSVKKSSVRMNRKLMYTKPKYRLILAYRFKSFLVSERADLVELLTMVKYTRLVELTDYLIKEGEQLSGIRG